MQIRIATFAPLIATVFLLASGAAGAQTSVDRSFEPAPKDCADVRWSQAALQSFPSIASACQAVEQRNGKTYVKFTGEVEEVRNEGKRIRVDMEGGNELTFRPTPNTGLYIGGERTAFAELRPGTQLNFYIPEDRLQAEIQPNPDRVAFLIVPLDIPVGGAASQNAAAAPGRAGAGEQNRMASNTGTLPRTAGPLPLIGMGGFALLLLAFGVTLRRKLR